MGVGMPNAAGASLVMQIKLHSQWAWACWPGSYMDDLPSSMKLSSASVAPSPKSCASRSSGVFRDCSTASGAGVKGWERQWRGVQRWGSWWIWPAERERLWGRGWGWNCVCGSLPVPETTSVGDVVWLDKEGEEDNGRGGAEDTQLREEGADQWEDSRGLVSLALATKRLRCSTGSGVLLSWFWSSGQSVGVCRGAAWGRAGEQLSEDTLGGGVTAVLGTSRAEEPWQSGLRRRVISCSSWLTAVTWRESTLIWRGGGKACKRQNVIFICDNNSKQKIPKILKKM